MFAVLYDLIVQAGLDDFNILFVHILEKILSDMESLTKAFIGEQRAIIWWRE